MVEYPIKLNERNENKLKLIIPKIFGKTKVVYNNIEFQKLNNRYSINNGKDKPVLLTLKNNLIDPVPKVFANNKQIQVARPIKWYEYIWMGLPIIIFFHGGLLGILLGYIAVRLNSLIFRNEKTQFTKYISTLGINVLIAMIYFITYLIITTLLEGMINE